jgi:plasmid stabilization system protein ParE
MRIELLDSAEQDLIEAAEFYEAQQSGLGAYFVDSLSSDIDGLLLHGGTHEKRHGYHRALAKRFPYAIYYQCDGDTIRVHAVLDCRQSPARSRSRLNP